MITIFTPVYNRADIIGQLYRSLLRQTNMDFEWLIIDDGSEDGIAETVYGWIEDKEASFDIRFYRQTNGGKHRAVNRGVELAKGDAFFIVDSDDYIADNAVQLIHKWWKEIAKDSCYAGVSGLRGNKLGRRIGDKPIFDVFVDATNIERKKYGLLGDKAEVYKTAVLKKYPFPEFEGENFLTEAVVWDKIAYDGLKIRWFNEVITICEYREDGLTNQGREIFIKNPIGWGKYIRQTCDCYNISGMERIHKYFNYYIELKGKISDQEIKNNLQISENTLIQVKQLYGNCINKTTEKIGKKVAVYGIGLRGKRVLKIYQETEVEVCYILDRNIADAHYLQKGIDEEYPEVDAIIVTPKYGQKEIIKFLKAKTQNRIVGYDEWEAIVFEEKIEERYHKND